MLVDVERARTVKGWLPRRLGGGLGGTRRGGPEVNIKHSGREDNERERERYRLEREREATGRFDRDRYLLFFIHTQLFIHLRILKLRLNFNNLKLCFNNFKFKY